MYQILMCQINYHTFTYNKQSISFTQDWNTLVVGKVSPWINTDSSDDVERKNSEQVCRAKQKKNISFCKCKCFVEKVALKQPRVFHSCAFTEPPGNKAGLKEVMEGRGKFSYHMGPTFVLEISSFEAFSFEY